ncbi:MAG TPA: fibronectin type III domain-containing protein [Acidothermaceae bacterium]|jgi:titin
MRKVLSSVLIGATSLALLSTTVLAASAATTAAAVKCNAIDAPKAMNDMPASADCPTPGATLHSNLAPLVTPVQATSPINSTPLAFDRTNGDLLAITKVSGTNDIAMGGNFTLVYTPDGVSHPAVNFAVVDETSGAILYAGNPSNSVTPSDNYVRAITSLNGVIYVGGDFDGWDGAARFHTAMLSPTGNPAPAAWAVTPGWNPSPSGFIRALQVDGAAVYMGGDSGFVTAVNPTSGATIWTHPVTGGAVHALLLDQGALFVGGLFETYNGYTQHGLVKVATADGSVITAFHSDLRADSGASTEYGQYDGEDTLTLSVAPNSTTQILIGVGGHAPAGLSSNETITFNITTGQRILRYGTTGDSQAVGTVGDTVVAGYHNSTTQSVTSANYFGIQLEASNFTPTTWDPAINGIQGNADGGNNGVQTIYVDSVNDIVFFGGGFLHWNGTTGLTHASLIAFSYTPSTATVSGSPTGVTAAAGNGNAYVSWTAPVSNGGSPISSYTVKSSPGGFTATSSTVTPLTVSGLTNGVSYTFTVTATNTVGASAPSTPSTPVTPASGGGSSNTAEGGTVGASVTAANSGGGSGDPFGVVNKGAGAALVYSTTADAHGVLGYSLTGSSGTATDVGWTGYNATSMAVRFYYNPGSTLPSTALRLADIRNATGTAARVVLTATNQLSVQNNAGSTITTFAHTLTANTWYRVEMAISVSSTNATINAAYYPFDSTTPVDPVFSTTTGNTGTANLTNVLIGSASSPTWTGTSFFDDLAVQPSATSFIGVYVPPGSTAPGAPTAVTAAPGDGQATVSWTPPTSNGGSGITGYTVTSSPGNFTIPSTGTSAIMSGLTDGTAYTFTVTATNAVGTSVQSVASTPVTPATVPGAPTGVSGVAGDGQVTVSWVAPTSNGGSAITGYSVTSSPGGLTGSSTGATSAVVGGLTDGTPYTFIVTATNAIGTGAASTASSSVTPVPAPTAPGAPSAVSATPGNNQATVSWAAASNGGSAITSYTVTSSGGQTQSTTGATSAVVGGLTNGTPYTFTVTATNSVGTGPSSVASSPVTPLSGSVKSNSAEGGTSGTSVTAANSGGASGNAFTVFTKGSGAAVVYSTAADAHGLLGYSITGASGTATSMGWNGYTSPSIALRFYYNPGPTLPSTVIRLADIRNASGTAARIELSAANQIFIQNNAGTTVTTFAHALHANTWYRIELAMSVSSSAATINAAYYLLDSTSPVDPAYATTTGNTGAANITQVTIGSTASATWTGTSYFDDVATLTPSTAFIGPVTSAPTAPSAPSAVSAVPADGQATVSWTAPANGGSAITGYTVTTSPGGATTPASGTSVLVMGLTDGTPYTFTVSATNGVGTSPASAPSSPVTPATAPGAPSAVSAVAGDGQATVSWTAPSNGGSAITGYTVTTSPGGATTPASGTSVLVTGLTDGTPYTFTVSATNGVGTSPASASSTPVTPAAPMTAPGAPTNVTAVAGDGQATVSWAAPAANGSPITSYTVTSSPGTIVVTSGTTSALVTGLTDGTPYTFTVTATNGVGPGPSSSPSSPVTPQPAPTAPDAPTIVSATSGNTEVIVTWTAPADGGSAITGYTVTASPGPGTATTAGATSAAVAGLTNGTPYTFTVTATNSIGTSVPSDPSAAVMPAPTVPAAPTGANAVAGDGQATVSWTDPNNDGGSAITGYTVTTSPGGTTTHATDTPVLIAGLTDGTSYTFTITATNSVGPSAESAASAAVIPAGAATAPDAPTGVSAVAGEGQATVSWVAPNSNGSGITSYTVTTLPDNTTTLSNGTGTSVVVPGLTDGDSYTFTVTATNGIGTSGQSAASTPVTPTASSAAPDAPTAVTAVAGDGQATVSWAAPNSNGSGITSYTVTTLPDNTTTPSPGVGTSVVVSGLVDGHSYTFTVTATNGVGTSGQSAASTPVTPTAAATAPGAPTNVVAVPGNGQATVSWNAASPNGSPITGYTVTSSPGSVHGSTAGATSAAVITLVNGTTYTFTVTATNSAGTGPASAASNAVTPTAGTFVKNSAEGGTSGAAVTVANSGGASGNALTVVSKGSGATLNYSTAAAAHGSLGYALTGTSGTATLMGWNGYSVPSMAIRFYYNPGTSLPNQVLRLADIRNSSATAARVELSASNQIFIQNAAGTTVTTFPHALSANTWYRVELTISVSASTATIKAAYYLGTSTTPVDTAYSTTTGNTGTANITQVSIGSAASATWAGTSFFDDLAAESQSTAFIGS